VADCFVDETINILRFAHIGDDGKHLAPRLRANVVGRLGKGFGTPGTYAYPASFGCQTHGDGPAQSFAGRCDDGDLACQAQIHGFLLPAK
jgi:hypothetical protein